MGETFQTGGGGGWVEMTAVITLATHTPSRSALQRPRRERPGTGGSSLEITAQTSSPPTALKTDQATCRAKCSPWGYRTPDLAKEA